ncbi:uncharacterized protein LOC122002207 [Zingiber officinale]|uniref:uncharacterized protein LOC122002207 n=1 Tax=Zingiber officinale TaxID=94328 RepID=UPI001C4C81A9|nr:uncharacterized protein LOC122002207 [Zingiber officinale]
MEFRLVLHLSLLILLSTQQLQARGESKGSVAFIDGYLQRYIRSNAQDSSGKAISMSLTEVAATISVLLGFAPPPSLPAASSSKLSQVLYPNPFDKPHAIFLLEVGGVVEPSDYTEYLNTRAGEVFKSSISGSSNAKLELPGEDEVSVVHLDRTLDFECNDACLDEELREFASWIGGSYVGSIDSSDWKLTISLSSGSTLDLHLTKKSDLQFASSLISLVTNVKKTMAKHEVLSGRRIISSEIMKGHFSGIEALTDEYGWGTIAHQGVELLQTVLVKISNMLQMAYGGKIVEVIILNEELSSESGILLDVASIPRISRVLEEASSSDTTGSEVLLVRRTLAWITGVILLISTFIGIYYLLNMPLTRDTLLYSNVKID